jgi:tetratricopeptide (TPR) repeat protein
MPQAEFERRVKADVVERGRALKVPPLFILDDAERFKARLDADPEDAVAHARYAEALAQRIAAAQGPVPNEVPDDVRAHAEKAIELDPSLIEPYTVLAFLELRSDKPEAAARYCNEALARDEGNYVAHFYLGDIAAAAERFDEAAQHYEAAKRTYPRQAELGQKLAAIYERAKQRDKAVAELEHVVRTDRNPYAALKQLGTFYEERQDWKDAIRHLEYALEFNLYDPELYALLLKAHEERDEDDQAAHCRTLGADVALFAGIHENNAQKKIALLRLALKLVPGHERTLEYIKQDARLQPALQPADEADDEAADNADDEAAADDAGHADPPADGI